MKVAYVEMGALEVPDDAKIGDAFDFTARVFVSAIRRGSTHVEDLADREPVLVEVAPEAEVLLVVRGGPSLVPLDS